MFPTPYLDFEFLSYGYDLLFGEDMLEWKFTREDAQTWTSASFSRRDLNAVRACQSSRLSCHEQSSDGSLTLFLTENSCAI